MRSHPRRVIVTGWPAPEDPCHWLFDLVEQTPREPTGTSAHVSGGGGAAGSGSARCHLPRVDVHFLADLPTLQSCTRVTLTASQGLSCILSYKIKRPRHQVRVLRAVAEGALGLRLCDVGQKPGRAGHTAGGLVQSQWPRSRKQCPLDPVLRLHCVDSSITPGAPWL